MSKKHFNVFGITYQYLIVSIGLTVLCLSIDLMSDHNYIAFAQDDDDIDALVDKGNSLVEQGKPEEAIVYYDRALEVDPDFILALYNKGNALDDLERDTEAIDYYDQALEIDPNYVDALINKGAILHELGNYQEAISHYSKALAVAPNDSIALRNIAKSYGITGNYQEALKYLDKSLEVEPGNAAALYNKGIALAGLGNYQEAIVYYDKVLEIEPGNVIVASSKDAALESLDGLGNKEIPQPVSQSINSGDNATNENKVSILPGSSTNPDANPDAESYSPNPINIKVGDTVTWTNDDGACTTITSGNPDTATPDGKFDSGIMGNCEIMGESGAMTFDETNTFTHKFNTAGEFRYFDTIHPWMQGKVIVTTSDSPTTITTQSSSPDSPSASTTLNTDTTSSSQSSSQPPPGFKSYDNPTQAIKLFIPSDWQISEGDFDPEDGITDIANFISPSEGSSDIYQDSLWLTVQERLPSNVLTLSGYMDYTIKGLEVEEDFKLIDSSTNTLFAGKPGYTLTYTINVENEDDGDGDEDVEVKSMETGTIIGNKAYYVTYFAEEEKFDDYLPQIRQIVDSIKINNDGN